MELIDFFDRIKKEFCSLFKYKLHGKTIEVITPFATLSDKFISVFITIRNDKIIVSDAGYVTKMIYELELSNNSERKEIIATLTSQFIVNHDINIQVTPDGMTYYFKSTDKIEMLPAIVFDIANFILNLVNTNLLEYKDKKEKEDRDKFKTETNEFLKDTYKDKFTPNKLIVPGLVVNGAIHKGKEMHLLQYVTGSTQNYLEQDIRKAIINFQLVIKATTIKPFIKNRIAIFNDLSVGFQHGVPPLLESHLKEFATKDYIKRSDLKNITELISLN